MMYPRVIFRLLAFSLLGFTGVLPAWTADRLISVPPGTYNLSEIVTSTGTAVQWVRYKPQTPGTVTIRGGGLLRNEYVILDGFFFNGQLAPTAPAKTVALSVDASNVKVENSELFAWHDIHTSYDISGRINCAESTDFPSAGGVLGVETDRQNVTFNNILVHGGYTSASLKKNSGVVVRDSLFRNSFNGISLGDVKTFEMTGSAVWMHPNHMMNISIWNGGVVRLENNLFMDGQDMLQAGMNWGGADELYMVHNTFWIPENKPCYGFTGFNFHNIRKRVVVKDTIVMTKNNTRWMGVRDALIPNLTSDYNLFYLYGDNAKEQFDLIDRIPKEVPYATWNAVTGQDSHSLIQQRAVFVDPFKFAEPLPEPGTDANAWGLRVPSSVTEARSWFKLASGSPGKNAASDGKDIGIVLDGIYVPPPLPPPPTTPPPTNPPQPPPSGSLPAPTLALPSHLPVNATLTAGYPAGYSNITFRWTINRATASGSGIGTPSTQPTALSPARTQSATFTSGATASLASYALDPGYYSVSVRAVDSSGKTSTAATGNVTLVAAEFAGVRVFPNPWRADKHSNKNVVFAGLPTGSTVKIFTVSGHHVKTLTPILTTATWDLTNSKGVKAASGIYVYVVKAGENSGTESEKATGQVMVIR